MEINQNAPVRQTAEILIHASPETVWKILTDVNAWTGWHKDISQANLTGHATPGETFVWKINGSKIKSTFSRAEENKVLGWTGKTFGATAIHNWFLETKNDGTLVRVEESMEGWLISLLSSMMNKSLKEGITYWLHQLKMESEKTQA